MSTINPTVLRGAPNLPIGVKSASRAMEFANFHLKFYQFLVQNHEILFNHFQNPLKSLSKSHEIPLTIKIPVESPSKSHETPYENPHESYKLVYIPMKTIEISTTSPSY